MKKIELIVADYIEKVLPKVLIKDLQDNERICPKCHGLGIIAVHHEYRIDGDTSEEAKKKHFPYDHQCLSFCSSCYNGVQRLCKYCQKPIEKGYTDKCDCIDYTEQKRLERKEKWADTVRKAKQVSEKDVTTMLYCEETDDYYHDSGEFLDSWFDCHEEDEEIPSVLWVTSEVSLSLDASSVLENACDGLHEDASDNCDYDELQKLLDEYAKKQTGTLTYIPSYKEYVLVER